MKATSIFGGVQVFQILIQIIRSKFIAILLGPAGMGIAGLLTSTIGLISGLTNFGLGTSAVKDIAAANGTGNEKRISTVVIVIRRLVWITGILGTVVVLILAQWLSQLTFGNSNYTIAFIWISITLLFNQITSGQMIILQGMRKLQYLAKANLYGSAVGLIITIPIYYKFGIDGIVPAIIITSLISLSLSWFFFKRINVKPIYVSKLRTIAEGKGMLAMGFMISLSGIITVGVSYIVRIFIGRNGGIDHVGLYSAGFAIINTYVGMVFSAMGTDYYPRLAGVASDNAKAKTTINEQAEISLLILTPILIIFLVYINWIIVLLYSTKFIAISGMVHWAALGIFCKAVTWSIGFIFLAKGASKIFFYSELASNSYLLLFNIIGYKYFGLDGLGISFLVCYILSLLQVYFIAKLKYEFRFERKFYEIFIIQLLIAIICFVIIKTVSTPYNYLVGTILIMLSTVYSLIELDKRIGLKTVVISIKNKLYKK